MWYDLACHKKLAWFENLQVQNAKLPHYLDGALLDHVYLHKTFQHDKLVFSLVNDIYFSDHDAVTVQLRFRQNSDNDIDFSIRV